MNKFDERIERHDSDTIITYNAHLIFASNRYLLVYHQEFFFVFKKKMLQGCVRVMMVWIDLVIGTSLILLRVPKQFPNFTFRPD